MSLWGKTMRTSVVLLSGGLDSATALWMAVRADEDVRALTILSKNDAEISAATKLAIMAGVSHTILDLTSLGVLYKTSPDMVFAVGGQIGQCKPSGKIAAPMGVAVMHTIAMMFAAAQGADRIIWSLHTDDLLNYSKREMLDYVKHLEAAGVTQGSNCKIEMPFLDMTKRDIVLMARELGVPIEITHSCLSPINGEHCGLCMQCKLREDAIKYTNVVAA